jgi:hypothetical protein
LVSRPKVVRCNAAKTITPPITADHTPNITLENRFITFSSYICKHVYRLYFPRKHTAARSKCHPLPRKVHTKRPFVKAFIHPTFGTRNARAHPLRTLARMLRETEGVVMICARCALPEVERQNAQHPSENAGPRYA